MEKIIKKAIEGGFTDITERDDWFNRRDMMMYIVITDPLFWQALFRNKTEALVPRQKFFSILFGDEGGEEGWDKAVEYLKALTIKEE